MRRQRELRDGEVVIVTVHPISRGLFGPLVVSMVSMAVVSLGNATWRWFHHVSAWATFVLIVPPVAVLAMRTLRSRSNTIVVTNQRVWVSTGVLTTSRSVLDLATVMITRVDQNFFDRLAKRGTVVIETTQNSWALARIRRPDALRRVIDHQRSQVGFRTLTTLDEGDRLSQALEEGLLSSDEYDQRWRHLFGPEGNR